MSSYAALQYRRAPASQYDTDGRLVPSKLSTNKAPPAIFQRSLAWRNKRDAKIRTLRKQQEANNLSAGMSFNAPYKDATVGEHIDAFHRYNMLVGEADGGVPLPEEEYRKLEKRCAKAAEDRLFCTWRNMETQMDCVNVGPMTRCFCGHSYRAHAFYRNESKKVHCRVPGCKCSLFHYVYHRGGRAVKCACKHSLENHRDQYNRPIPCTNRNCSCARFAPTVTCTCEMPASSHETVFERQSERAETGRVTRSLWNAMENDGKGLNDVAASSRAGRDIPRSHRAMAAGAGGLTSYLSLAPGTERVLVAPDAALPAKALEEGGLKRGYGGGRQWQQYATEERHKRILNDAGEDVGHQPGLKNVMPVDVSQQRLSERDLDNLLFRNNHRQQSDMQACRPENTSETLSPLSKHVAEHQYNQQLGRKTLQEQHMMLQNQWNKKHHQQYLQDQHIRNSQDQRKHKNNLTNSDIKTSVQTKVDRRSGSIRRAGQVGARSKRRQTNRQDGNLPSYMRSTAATRLWKSSTEAEKKKPKGQRTEIY